MVCREVGVVRVMEGGWSEAVVERDVGGGGGCCEAVVESDVGGGGGCCEAVVESDVSGGWCCGWWLVQNNDSKRKTANSKITALLTRIIPSNNGGETYLNTDLAI